MGLKEAGGEVWKVFGGERRGRISRGGGFEDFFFFSFLFVFYKGVENISHEKNNLC